MRIPQTAAFQRLHRLLKFIVGLSGETDNDIGCDVGVIKGMTQPLNGLNDVFRGIMAVHATQRFCAAALHRQMEMPAEVFHFGKALAKCVIDNRGL